MQVWHLTMVSSEVSESRVGSSRFSEFELDLSLGTFGALRLGKELVGKCLELASEISEGPKAVLLILILACIDRLARL